MLLNALHARLARLKNNDEGGAVLIAVIGVSAIVLIVSALVASSAVATTVYSATTRASLQSRAAAEAGIDIVWASMERSTFYCTTSATTTTGLTYAATVEYFDEDGDPLSCVGSSNLVGVPASAVVTSTGTAENAGIGAATSGNQRTVISFLDIVVNSATVSLDKVFFSDGGFTVTNDLRIIDSTGLTSANLYSNGDVVCNTQTAVQGSVSVQGNFSAGNSCLIGGTLWAGGSINMGNAARISGDLLSAGGTSATPSGVTLNQAWVGGSVVANGSINTGPGTPRYCDIAGYNARVCGSMVSIEGGVTLTNGANVAGNVMAKRTIDLGTINNALIVGGNAVSTTGNLVANNFGNSGTRVNGYAAVGGTNSMPKARMGNQASSCATGTSGYSPCTPAQPSIPLAGLPDELNYPTNSRVVAPPRESLPRINSDALSLTKWTGWTIETVSCAGLDTRIAAGWSGKLLLNVVGCATPKAWGNGTISLPGDLAIINPAGFAFSNEPRFTSSSSTAVRTFMLIVPSDAKLANGTTPLVTWTNPISTDPGYSKPSCAAGSYGDITGSKLFTTRMETFIYTPCDFSFNNELNGFVGQIYAGTSSYPNTSTLTYKSVSVPGATTATPTTGPSVVATETSRFDARG